MVTGLVRRDRPMRFNSIEYFVFLALTLAALFWWSRDRRVWRGGLVVASQIFYGWWDWRFLALFWFTILANWWFGERIAGALRSGRGPRGWLAAGVAVDIAILGLFKYADFFAQSLRRMLGALGHDPGWPLLHIILPLGISFFTFQAIAYLVDIRRGRTEPARSLFEFALFLGFFPQVSAGPIPRAADLIPQLRSPGPVGRKELNEAGFLILWGLFKKVVVADTLALHVDRVYALAAPDAGMVLVGMLGFTFQIYADFSAYSDLAIGSALLMGIRLQRNFAEPYLALGPGEFWQRWHITLSQWLRDYLFFPLGGASRGEWRLRANMLITFAIGGLWHGAAWTFVVWGIYQGLFLVVGRTLDSVRRQRYAARHGGDVPRVLPDPPLLRLGRWALTFGAIMGGMAIFRADDLAQVGAFGAALLRGGYAPDFRFKLLVVAGYAVPLVIHDLVSRRAGTPCWPVKRGPLLAVGCLVALLYGVAILGMASSGRFIYFQY